MCFGFLFTLLNFLISNGKLFHNVGPTKEKAQSPYVFVLVLRTAKTCSRRLLSMSETSNCK